MTIAAEDALLNMLSPEEARAINAAVMRCAASTDSLVKEIGVVYLRGMCDILRVQGKLTSEVAEGLEQRVKGC